MKKNINISEIVTGICSMIDKVNWYGGSSEVEWAYGDFRSDTFEHLSNAINHSKDMRIKSCLLNDEETWKAVGQEICKAIYKEYRDIRAEKAEEL